MKILVVEDDQLVAHALAAVLTNQNYVVEVACDGQAAWDLIETFDYDLILLDVILPKIDGISLCRQIRSKGLRMPILLLTGCDSSHEKAIGLDAGADDYLVKPFDEEELVARIRALLRRGSVASQPVLSWGNLQLDPKSCEVTYAEKHLSLTPKEYALLELFLRNNRRVFSSGMILEHLWSYEDTPGEEAVRTHIKGLRQKLKAVGASGDLIETVYGIGYRLKQQAQAKRATGGEDEGDKAEVPPHPLTPAPVNETQQQTLVGVAGVWNRFKGRVDEQVSLLEETARASAQKALTQKLRKEAQKEAHTLAGSLGTFGFCVGSKVARKIEHLLKSSKALTPDETNELCALVKQLRQELEQNHNETLSLSATGDEQSLLLVVDHDAYRQDVPHLCTLAEEIEKESVKWGLKVAIATTIEQARHQLYHEHPSVVLIDPSAFPNHEDSFSLLAELNQRKPPVPVLVFTEQSDFTNRLQVARSGTHSFLQKPMPISQVLEAVTQVLQNAPYAEAHVLVVDDDPKIGAVLQTLLSPWGIKVTTLQDPQRFWETLEAVKPDLLILDVEIPEVNGIEICKVVRHDPCWSELPILFLTVHSDANIVNQVFAAGADDFVSKPIVGPELVTRIINRLERIKLRQCITQTNQAKSELNEYQRTQEELRNSQALFAGIVSIADDAIISIDGNQCITLFNQGAEKIFGYSAQEVLGQPLDILLPLRYAQAHHVHVIDFGESAKVARRMGERREIYGRRKDGTEFPAEASISKLKLGEEIVYTVYLHDISECKQVERMKDEFVSVVSHELRTPLTSIHGSLGMLASGLIEPNSEQGKRLLHIAVDSTERLVRLINDILEIERIESGQVKKEKQLCNIADLIAKAVNVIQPLADKAGITLAVSSLSQQLWVDPDRIVETLTNLLSNAVKFSPVGSTVWLSAEIPGDKEEPTDPTPPTPFSSPSPVILFTIRDQGRGIPSDKLDSIFERFQQVDSSDSRNHDGTGLGLAICKSIVQHHGGHIWVESVLGEGSTFYFTLSHFPIPHFPIPPQPNSSSPHYPTDSSLNGTAVKGK
ncbi:response regulator [Mastigocladopsis repens]|uniref:response regulator n=1 Tax=Mastigocladopsis repens TaxID=221287 RepID=UPI0002DC7E27